MFLYSLVSNAPIRSHSPGQILRFFFKYKWHHFRGRWIYQRRKNEPSFLMIWFGMVRYRYRFIPFGFYLRFIPSVYEVVWGHPRSQKTKASKNEPQNQGVKNLWYIHHTQNTGTNTLFYNSIVTFSLGLQPMLYFSFIPSCVSLLAIWGRTCHYIQGTKDNRDIYTDL